MLRFFVDTHLKHQCGACLMCNIFHLNINLINLYREPWLVRKGNQVTNFRCVDLSIRIDSGLEMLVAMCVARHSIFPSWVSCWSRFSLIDITMYWMVGDNVADAKPSTKISRSSHLLKTYNEQKLLFPECAQKLSFDCQWKERKKRNICERLPNDTIAPEIKVQSNEIHRETLFSLKLLCAVSSRVF